MGNTVKKNQTAKVGDKYSYKYVDIAQIHEYLESINAKYIQQVKRIEGDDYIITKRCFNDKWEEEWLQGCKIVDATLVGVKNPAQEQGSALTYARRYSLLMAFGLATEDDDANSLSRPKVEENKKVILATPKQIEILENNCTDEEKQKIYEMYNVKNISELEISVASKLVSRKLEKGE